jgi:uncharacterized protein YuzE
MRAEYDKSANSLYIYIKQIIENGEVKQTYPCNPKEVGGEINLDFDKNGYLIGIEVLDADTKVSKEFLEAADKI